MARKVLVRLVDDLDGSPSSDVAPVTFALDGVTYQIDLNQRNAGRLRESLAAFVASARRTSGRAKRGTAMRAGGASVAGDVSAIREWAKEQGLPVSARGRIPANILDAYNSANGSAATESAPRAARTKTAAVVKSAPTATAPARRGRPANKPAAAKSAPRAGKTTTAKSAAAAKSTAAKAGTAKATGRTTRAAAAKAKPAAAKTTAKAAPKTTARSASAKAAPAKATAAKATRSTRSAASKPAARTAARTAAKTAKAAAPAPRRAVARKAKG